MSSLGDRIFRKWSESVRPVRSRMFFKPSKLVSSSHNSILNFKITILEISQTESHTTMALSVFRSLDW